MELSKHIPSRKHTVKFNWCKKDFMPMSQRFRDARARSRNPMDTCFWCGHKFIDGEMMALAQPIKGANKVLCQDCADEALKTPNQRIQPTASSMVADSVTSEGGG